MWPQDLRTLISLYMGFPTVEGGMSNACSWNAPIMPFRVIQLRAHTQCKGSPSERQTRQRHEMCSPERSSGSRLVLTQFGGNLVERLARL